MSNLENLRAAGLFLHRQWKDIDSLVRGNIGLHSTDYASPYLSAWARLSRFDAANLFWRLNTGQGLVRINAMRNTVHVVQTDDLPLISVATGEAVRQVGRRIPALRPLSETQIRAGLESLYAALEAGPLDNNALKAALPTLAENIRYWLMMGMGEGQILRADAAHARSNRSRFALSRQWVPGFGPGEVPAAEARIRCRRSY